MPDDKPVITYDDFAKLDLRVAKVLEVRDHPNADKLLCLTVDLGGEPRQIIAGIRASENPIEIGVRLSAFDFVPFKPNPELAEPRLGVQPLDSALLAGQGGSVKRVDDADWVPRNSSEGQAIISESLRGCPDGSPVECHP